jgi:hypothetical protein
MQIKESPGFGLHAGVLVNERFLKEDVVTQLRLALRGDRRFDETFAAEFLRATAEEACQAAAEGEAPTPGAVKAAMGKLAKEAEDMQKSLQPLAGEADLFLEFQNQWEVLRLRDEHASDLDELLQLNALASGEPRLVPDAAQLLEQLWRDLEAVRAAAQFAQENAIAPQEAKHAAMRAKSFVTRVAERYRGIYGCLPPKTKTTWFPAYMAIAGMAVKISCTESITEAAITEQQDRDRERSGK